MTKEGVTYQQVVEELNGSGVISKSDLDKLDAVLNKLILESTAHGASVTVTTDENVVISNSGRVFTEISFSSQPEQSQLKSDPAQATAEN